LAHALGSLRPTITLTSKTSPSEWNVAVQRLQQAEPVLCIGTKRTIFLPWSLCTMVIVDQEEARAHKQFDGNPRYHVRAVAEWLAVNAVTDVHTRPTVIYTSHAPSIDRMAHAQQDGDVILHIPRPLPLDHVRVVDMEHERQNKNYSWFSDTVVEAIQSSTKSFVFFNRVGRYGSAVCVDCGTLLPLEVDVCTQCHSQRIRFTRKGTQELERELRQRFPKKRILRIDRDQDAAAMTREQIDRAELIIGTEKVLHMLPLSYFECICVLSVDHLLVYPHFRSHERVYQLLSELCSIPVPTYVQTSAPQHSVIRNATQNAYDPFFTEELSVRKLLRLPPFGERFLLKNTKSGATKTVSGPLSPAQISTDTVVDRQ
jgi:primosomal protein N' (replication factor Y)